MVARFSKGMGSGFGTRSHALLLVAFVFVLCTSLLAPVRASDFYPEGSSSVVELTDTTFKSEVLGKADTEVWVVEFYAPWCGHCKALTPEYEKAARALDGIGVHLGAVDMTQYQSVGQPYGVSGFPTIKVFGKDANKPKDFNGARTAGAIVDSAMSTLKSIVKARLKPQGNKGSKPSGGRTGGGRGGGGGGSTHGSGAVMELDEDSFDEEVFEQTNTDLKLVAFVAPWCGHCKNLLPEWETAAADLTGTGVELYVVDATASEQLAARFQVQGYPTIKVFPPGRVGDEDVTDYQGPREAAGIANFALNEFERLGGSVTVEIIEINNPEAFSQVCRTSKGKCALAFLPDIRDSLTEGRQKYLETLEEVQKKNRHTPIGWVAAGFQPSFESAFDMNFGFPTMVYLRETGGKQLGFLHRGKFTQDALGAFLIGRKSVGEAVVGWPKVSETDKWDGKDAPALEEDDDFDLEAFLADED